MTKQRTRRRRSTRSGAPSRGPAIVRAMGPADLLRAMPELVGVEHDDSLVIVLFRHASGTRSRTHGAMRVDLTHTPDGLVLERWAADLLTEVLRVEGVTGVALVACTPETFAPSGRPPAAAQLRAVARQAERRGLEVLDRLVVAADGWGSIDDPALPRGGRPLTDIAPPSARPLQPRGIVDVPLAGGAARLAFDRAYAAWWTRTEGPGGVLHGVRLTSPGASFGPAAEGEPAMERYRWGRGIPEVVDLVEAMLEPHDADTGTPCPCRALLLALAERQGVENLVLLQLAWGRAFGMEIWTAAHAPAGREKSLERLAAAICGGPFRRPDPDRIEAAIALVLETSRHVPEEERAPLDSMLAWLLWSRGGSSAAAAYALRALRREPDRDVAALVLSQVERRVLPAWAYRADAGRPDPFAALLGAEEPVAG